MSPILFEIRFNDLNILVYSYIFFSILSIVLVSVSIFIVFRKKGLNRIVSILGIMMVLLFTFVGARLLGVLYKYPYYIDGLSRILSLKYRDFSLFGGLIFAVTGGYAFFKIIKNNILKISDELVFPVGAGIILWRIGCFLNGCCTGRGTGSVFGVRFNNAWTLVHPTQIYEIIAVVLIFIILFFIRKKIKRQGIFSLIFYSLFALSYLLISIFRERTLYGIILSLVLSVILLSEIIFIGITESRIQQKQTKVLPGNKP